MSFLNYYTMKTRLEYLKKLPLQKRLQVMEFTRKNYRGQFKIFLNQMISQREFTLFSFFVFAKTKQGHEYWVEVYRKYFN